MNQQILAEKKETVSKINETLKVSHSVVIVSYSGLSVADVTQLRIDLKKAGARLSVHKNSLLKKAVDEDVLSQLDGLLKGPNALIVSKEEGDGLSVIKSFAESHKKNFAIKGGRIGGGYCDAEKLNALAAIGNKNNARSILLSTLTSPLTQLALTLKALAEKNGGAEEAKA